MIPASIGGSILQPSVNSLLTRRVKPDEVGGTLGISAAFLSGANAWRPCWAARSFKRSDRRPPTQPAACCSRCCG